MRTAPPGEYARRSVRSWRSIVAAPSPAGGIANNGACQGPPKPAGLTSGRCGRDRDDNLGSRRVPMLRRMIVVIIAAATFGGTTLAPADAAPSHGKWRGARFHG